MLDKEPPRPRSTSTDSVWPIRNAWNRETENLYSAWIEKLFDAPLDATLSWPALHEVLRDRSRNFLLQPSGSQRRLDEDVHPPRLRRPAVFPARLFRVQDGAAVRLREVHARRRRRAAEVLRVVEHPESRAAADAAREELDAGGGAGRPPAPPSIVAVQTSSARRGAPPAGSAGRRRRRPPSRDRGQAEGTAAEARRARAGVRLVSADRRRRRPFRRRAHRDRPTTTPISIRCR